MATKTCLVLTMKNNKAESVSCKECDRVDAAGESSRLQLFMLMSSFLSLVVWHSYFIIKFKIFYLCVIIDLVFRVTYCFINSFHFVNPASFAFNPFVNKVFIMVKLKSHSKRLDCTILLELILVSLQGSADKG